MSEWVSVKDAWPRDGSLVAVASPDGTVSLATYDRDDDGNHVWTTFGRPIQKIRYWFAIVPPLKDFA